MYMPALTYVYACQCMDPKQCFAPAQALFDIVNAKLIFATNS